MYIFVQVNLDRSRLSNLELRRLCEKQKVDVGYIQEAYTSGAQLRGMPADATTILPEAPNSMLATVVFNKEID